LLTREFGGESTCVFVMLNPSTADAKHDDPTIRRCIGFAKREGFGRLEVVNLFGFRATSPSDLFASDDPVGQENDRVVKEALAHADQVIAAWGNYGGVDRGRVEAISRIIGQSGKSVRCLGLTASGQPRHPLYLPSGAGLMKFAPET
jgi:hypothetical protein